MSVEYNQCIYCLGTAGIFQSKSHYIGEGLGCPTTILPPGYECDGCNHGLLASLDNWLQQSPMFGPLRVIFVSRAKNGKLPKALYPSISIERTTPTDVNIRLQGGSTSNSKSDLQLIWEEGANELEGTIDTKKLVRYLFKVALADVASKMGHQFACDSRFDKARKFILGRKNETFPNNLLIAHDWKSLPIINVQHVLGTLGVGTIYLINFYGVTMLINLEEYPKLESCTTDYPRFDITFMQISLVENVIAPIGFRHIFAKQA